jgi:hydroxyethylthiazole kinase-like uncharacterized protein yjeF
MEIEMQLVTANQMQAMDRNTIETFGLPGRVLMENAGRGATEILFATFNDLNRKKIGVMAGRGNNGGDGFVIARYLAQQSLDVAVYLLTQKSRVAGDAKANLDLLYPLQVPVTEILDEKAFQALISELGQIDLWIDAILGTGLKSEVKGFFKKVIAFVNRQNKPVLAVDIPSGLNSDTGQPCGICIRAHTTATFAFAKVGHILFPGSEFTGKLKIVDIGIPPHIFRAVDVRTSLIEPCMMKNSFVRRAPDAHKGDTGHLLVIAGSPGKTGAAAMTAAAAMRAGAGLVTLGIPKSLNAVLETLVVEAMTCQLPENDDGVLTSSGFDIVVGLLAGKKCLALGPGLGTFPETADLVCRIAGATKVPMVIDADGLNILAGQIHLLKALKAPAVLTPHPGEMARLADRTTSFVQKNRVECARDFAMIHNVHLVLKGAKTVVAHPDGNVVINPTGNAGMASGGMGDVLTGVIAGLITQGIDLKLAVSMGVYLHGVAADSLARHTGPFGYLATDVIKELPKQINRLAKEKSAS